MIKNIQRVCILCMALILVSCKQEEVKTKPNILFILADDFGYTDMSCMGSAYYETPNIDRIATEGIRFTDGYAACQVCSPSRASILTGKFPARHGITNWIGEASGEAWRKQKRYSKILPAEYAHRLDTSFVTLPEALREAGYKTFFAGKWHIGEKGSWPEDHGFEINKGGWDAGSPKGGYFAPFKNPNLEDHERGENLSLRLAGETVNFMKENNPAITGKPFLAYLSFYAVHGPIQTTQMKWKKYRDKADSMGIAPSGFEMGHFLPIRQVQDNPVYAGLVEQMDDAIGVVLKALDEMGLDKNTIVVFTSDNGGVAAGDAYSTSNKPLRAGKGYQFEGGIREPYFIKVPWLNLGGVQCAVPVSGTDFYPTLLELVGEKLRPNQHQDGVSFVPLFMGDSIPERALIWHYPHYGNQGGEPSSIIRKGDWKLIYYYEDGHEELYNLTNDISETTDLSADKPELVKQLDAELFAYLKSVNANMPEPDPEYDAAKEKEYLEQLITKKWPAVESQRLKLLDPDFNPDNNWWGSQVTND